jgi:8-oxo-dGTP pyrophosphatase MutT (NUDIX family)
MPGAGLLPIATHKGKIYFLFGRENKYNDTPGWSDFGGGMEKGESVMDTNLREIEEETAGFLHREEIMDAMDENGILVFTMKPGGRNYTTTIVKIPFDKNLPIYFNKNRKIVEKYVDSKIIKNNVIFEKDRLKWFTFEEMLDRIHEFRSFYQTMVQKLISQYKKIEKFAS